MLLNIIASSSEDAFPIEYVDRVLALYLCRNDPVLALLYIVPNYFHIDQHIVDRCRIQLVEVSNELKCLFLHLVARLGGFKSRI